MLDHDELLLWLDSLDDRLLRLDRLDWLDWLELSDDDDNDWLDADCDEWSSTGQLTHHSVPRYASGTHA